jgi:uncharacterized protein YhaN
MMRIEHLDLYAYGHYQDTGLDLSRPHRGLTVVYGPNEAGKSTARRALLAALFGFERDNQDAYRFSRHGLRVGVCLTAANGAALSFVRQGLSNVVSDEGTVLDGGIVEQFRGGIGRPLYTRLFSVDHDELRTGSEALLGADGEIGRLVFGASLGSGSVAAVLGRLEERAAKLFQERGRAQEIHRALDSYRGSMRQAIKARVRSRDWDRLRQAVDDATEHLTEVRGAFSQARSEQARLARIRSARPLIARRANVANQIATIGNAPSTHWADRALDALTRYRDQRSVHDRAVAEHDRLASEVAEIEVPDALLERADRIDELIEGIGRYRKDAADLPKRHAELEAAHARVAEQLGLLGISADDGRIVAESDLVPVEVLARRYLELAAEGRTALHELRNAEDQIGAARAYVAGLAEPPDVAALDRVLRLVQPKLQVAREVAEGTANQAVDAADLAALAARLGLEALAREDVESLTVPAMADIDAERERRQSHRLHIAQIDDELDKLEGSLGTIEEQVANAVVTLLDPDRLGSAREHRDAGWRLVRRTLDGAAVDSTWSADIPLADAYEAAVADADQVADERYEHANDIATLTQLRARKAEMEGQRRELEERRRGLVNDNIAATASWEARLAAIGVGALTPDAMAAWISDERELVAGIGRWRRQEAKLNTAKNDVARQHGALVTVLVELGHEPCSDELDLLFAQATEIAENAHAMADARHGAVIELRLAERDEPRRQVAFERHEDAMTRWRQEWVDALQPLSLGASTGADVASVVVGAYRMLAAARREVTSLQRRIKGIEADCQVYLDQVTAAAIDIIADADDGPPLATVSELQRRLSEGRAAQERRQTLTNELEQTKAIARQAISAVDNARRDLLSLRLEVAMAPSDDEPDAGMDEVIDSARVAARLREKLEEVEADLLEQGDGRSIEQIEREEASVGETLVGEFDAASAEVEALQGRLERATSQLADARRALEAVTDTRTAADLEQDAETQLALASELTSEYTRTALAAEVLRRTITDYGERQREPLLFRATEVFRKLTDGVFTELVVDADGDRQVLLAKRRNGELCATAALSDGTRDQLYLALRLAGIEHQLVGRP